MGRNPIQSAGCFGILKAVQENTGSAMEALNFAVSLSSLTSWNLFPFADLLTFCVSLVGHHGEPGTWRLVCDSERNVPCAYSKSWGQNWHIQKSKSLKSVTVIAERLCQKRWREACQSPVDFFINRWSKRWMAARISFLKICLFYQKSNESLVHEIKLDKYPINWK